MSVILPGPKINFSNFENPSFVSENQENDID
jgi:hypothetical protein